MGCDSSILRKKEEPDRPDYVGPTKVISPDSHKKQSQRQQKQSPVRGKPPKYRTKIDSRVLAKYDVKALIGKGSFSDVLRVENKITKQPYAVKILRLKNQHSKEVSQSELCALTRIRFPYIIHLIEVFESKDCVYLVMELATGGELYERIKMKGHLSEKESIRILQMVLEGVIYLHGKGITHRDLKPENLLFYHPGQDSKVLITDFGFAKSTSSPEDNTLFTTWCGTPEYIAPELLCKKPYTNSVDMWAIGVITYVMISGHLPFAAETPSKLYQQIVRAKYSYTREIWKHTSDGAKAFIDQLLQIDPDKRLKAVDARKDPWVNSVAPLVSHKGHSSKYLSSQVSGKSVKSSITFRSPIVRHKKFEDESVSHGSHDNERNTRNIRKYLDAKLGSDNAGENRDPQSPILKGGDERKLSKESHIQETAMNGYPNGLMPPEVKEKAESVPPSFQEEFPSAAATEDSNSLASRIERNGSEQEFVSKEFSQPKRNTDVESQITQPPPNFALNRFVNDNDLRVNWPARQNLSYDRDPEEISPNGNKANRRKDELDLLFSPLQRSNLRWHMQENTSVKDKVGLWLEGQNGYYRDDRLSASSGIIDQINKSELRNRDIFNQSDLQNGFPGLSASSSPIKHSYATTRNFLPNVKLKNHHSADLSPQVSFSTSSDANLAADGGLFNQHSTFRSNGLMSDNFQGIRNGLEMHNLQRKEYNDIY